MSSLRVLIEALKIKGLKRTKFQKSRAMRKANFVVNQGKATSSKGKALSPKEKAQRKLAAKASAKKRKGKKVAKNRLLF